MKRITTKTTTTKIIIIIIIIIQSPSQKAETKIPIKIKKRLAHTCEPSPTEHKRKIILLHYDVLHIYSKLKVVKCILGVHDMR
jgi:hypothetical protein